MKPRDIIINPDGLTAKAKNTFDEAIIKTGGLVYDPIVNPEWKAFEAANPSYPLTEQGEPGKECLGVLIKQAYYYSNEDGIASDPNRHKGVWKECGDTLYNHGISMGGNEVRLAWQVVSNKEETPEKIKTPQEILNDTKCFRGNKHIFHYTKVIEAMVKFKEQFGNPPIIEQAVTEQSIESIVGFVLEYVAERTGEVMGCVNILEGKAHIKSLKSDIIKELKK